MWFFRASPPETRKLYVVYFCASPAGGGGSTEEVEKRNINIMVISQCSGFVKYLLENSAVDFSDFSLYNNLEQSE